MNLTITQLAPGVTEVAFNQENLDAGNVKSFRDAMQTSVSESPVLLLDMSALQFVDSSGLGALLSVLRGVNNQNGQLRLFAITKPVMALLELVRMHRIFAIFGTRDQAVEDLGLMEHL